MSTSKRDRVGERGTVLLWPPNAAPRRSFAPTASAGISIDHPERLLVEVRPAEPRSTAMALNITRPQTSAEVASSRTSMKIPARFHACGPEGSSGPPPAFGRRSAATGWLAAPMLVRSEPLDDAVLASSGAKLLGMRGVGTRLARGERAMIAVASGVSCRGHEEHGRSMKNMGLCGRSEDRAPLADAKC